MCVWYTLHCLQSTQSSLPQYYSLHSTTMVNEYLWACIGGPFLHSSLIFNCCIVEFLTCTQHSENHADPLVQSLTISNSKTKHEAAMWSNTRRTFYGYTQTPMLWRGKSISQRTKLTQTSLSHVLYICGHTESETSKLAIQVMNVGTKTLQNMQFYL